MKPICAKVVLTGSTCGEACWHAKEEICRCSCGGVNHGCLLVAGAEQPQRQAKIMGERWRLIGVGRVDSEAKRLNKEAGISFVYAHTAREHFGEFPVAIMRMATVSQIAKWPELTAYRSQTPSDRYSNPPYLLWQRITA